MRWRHKYQNRAKNRPCVTVATAQPREKRPKKYYRAQMSGWGRKEAISNGGGHGFAHERGSSGWSRIGDHGKGGSADTIIKNGLKIDIVSASAVRNRDKNDQKILSCPKVDRRTGGRCGARLERASFQWAARGARRKERRCV